MTRRASPSPPTPANSSPNKQWFDALVNTVNDAYAGTCTTATRPTGVVIGFHIYDTTINQPIWVKSVNPTVWVNGVGTVV